MQYLNAEGSFDCITTEPTAGWIGESGENGTPFIRIPVQVTDDGPSKGHGAIWQGWLSEKAFDNTIKRLAEVLGFDGDLHGLTVGKQTLAGRPCNIQTEFEDYNGKRSLKVKWLNAPGGGNSKPMDPVKLKSLVQRLQTRAQQVAKAATSQDAGAAKKVASDLAANDVPF